MDTSERESSPESTTLALDELRAIRQEIALLRDATTHGRRMCPVCVSEFAAFAPKGKRPFARCPACGLYERHRLVWLYLKRETQLFRAPTRFLHFAPEPSIARKIDVYATIDYTKASYDPEKPQEGVDLQNLPYADGSFDLILCSHVLEHVPDDRRALRELHRVLSPQGLLLLLVPVRSEAKTYEDPSITSPEDREKHFGQFDHLRWYGRDFAERVAATGFAVKTEYYSDAFSLEDQLRYGIRPEPIFAARK